jgi:hypothetical protein
VGISSLFLIDFTKHLVGLDPYIFTRHINFPWLTLQQLAQADRNIAQVRAHVVRQRQIVLDLLLADQPREEAASLLERLEESLRAFERQRQLILDRFQRAE